VLTKTVSQVLSDVEDTKIDYRNMCSNLSLKAIELGMNQELAKDVRLATSYLFGYLKGQRDSR
jgi:hypothetical protein